MPAQSIFPGTRSTRSDSIAPSPQGGEGAVTQACSSTAIGWQPSPPTPAVARGRQASCLSPRQHTPLTSSATRRSPRITRALGRQADSAAARATNPRTSRRSTTMRRLFRQLRLSFRRYRRGGSLRRGISSAVEGVARAGRGRGPRVRAPRPAPPPGQRPARCRRVDHGRRRPPRPPRHRDTATTLRVCAHLMPGAHQRATDIVGDMFGD